MARKQIGDVSGQVVGDIGCGHDAKLAQVLFGRAAEVHLFDLTIDANLETETSHLHLGELPAMLNHVEPEVFDALILNNVLEHLTERELTLKEIHRILKSDGRVFVNVPTWRGKVALEFAAFKLSVAPAEEMDDHKTYFDKRTLWPMLVAAGFKPSRLKMRTHKLGLNLFAIGYKD